MSLILPSPSVLAAVNECVDTLPADVARDIKERPPD
jgi:hypothetical protein